MMSLESYNQHGLEFMIKIERDLDAENPLDYYEFLSPVPVHYRVLTRIYPDSALIAIFDERGHYTICEKWEYQDGIDVIGQVFQFEKIPSKSELTDSEDYNGMTDREAFLSYITGCFNTYKAYLQGDFCGYTITFNGLEVDSCWGFESYNAAEDAAKEFIDCMGDDLLVEFTQPTKQVLK